MEIGQAISIPNTTRQLLQNMTQVIEGAGGRMEDVAKTTVFITDIKYREEVGRVRKKFFKGEPPANTLLVVAGFADPELLVEMRPSCPCRNGNSSIVSMSC